MTGLEAQVIMDYTTVPIGWWIEGRLWSGHSTRSTATCPSCGRTGVISAPEYGKRIIVHTGSVAGNTLTGIDYCELGFEKNHIRLSRVDPNSRLYLSLESRTQCNERNAAIISRADSPVTVRVMKTNEELMIARHTRDLVGSWPSVKSRGAGNQGRTR